MGTADESGKEPMQRGAHSAKREWPLLRLSAASRVVGAVRSAVILRNAGYVHMRLRLATPDRTRSDLPPFRLWVRAVMGVAIVRPTISGRAPVVIMS